jgi:hypothetical protein
VDEIPAPVSFIQDCSKYTSNDSGVSTSTTPMKATATATTTSWSLQRCPRAQQSSAVATLRAHPGTVLRYIAVFSAQVFTVHVHCSCSLLSGVRNSSLFTCIARRRALRSRCTYPRQCTRAMEGLP